MATRLDQLYEDDFYAWTRNQAQALRRLAATRPNEAIDFPHLIEEVQDLGIGERNACRSQVARIIEHMLKLEHSPAAAPRDGWYDSIADARRELEFRLTASLRRDLVANLARLYAAARGHAARALKRHGETEAGTILPDACPYSLDQLLDADWLPQRRDA